MREPYRRPDIPIEDIVKMPSDNKAAKQKSETPLGIAATIVSCLVVGIAGILGLSNLQAYENASRNVARNGSVEKAIEARETELASQYHWAMGKKWPYDTSYKIISGFGEGFVYTTQDKEE